MRKIFLLGIFVCLIVILSIIGFFWLTSSLDDGVKAQLVVEKGTVEVKYEGEAWALAQNGTLLRQYDSVRTGNNSTAKIILFKSSIIRLDSNTEIMLKELLEQEGETSVSIQQDAGRTWNTVVKISGIDNYDVHTPTAIASVRGTSFDVNHLENDTTIISVGIGTTNVSGTGNGTSPVTIDVNENESVAIYPNDTSQPPEKKPLFKDDWIRENLGEDKEFLQMVKAELYERLDPYIPELKERYGVTDDELDVLLDGYLLGYYDLPPETPDWMREIIELS